MSNVLRAEREPWLVIDPKPFVGDPAYDATQHLFNCESRLRSDPSETICRIADLLEVDRNASDYGRLPGLQLNRGLLPVTAQHIFQACQHLLGTAAAVAGRQAWR
jgi:Aminoglycoside/hydroxyurea antibiotic resistance kinase